MTLERATLLLPKFPSPTAPGPLPGGRQNKQSLPQPLNPSTPEAPSPYALDHLAPMLFPRPRSQCPEPLPHEAGTCFTWPVQADTVMFQVELRFFLIQTLNLLGLAQKMLDDAAKGWS